MRSNPNGPIEYKSPFIYYTKKWEFVYGDTVPVSEGIPYTFWRPKNKKIEIYHTTHRKYSNEEIVGWFLDNSTRPSFRSDLIFKKIPGTNENYSVFQQYYKFTNTRNSEREIYLRPSRILVTEAKRIQGIMDRYFARSVLEPEKIFEIDELRYDLSTPVYEKIRLLWMLKGNKEEIRMMNDYFLMDANKKMNGIRDFLDPLEFYKEELTPLEELQERLGTRTSDSTPPPPPPSDLIPTLTSR